MAPDSLHRARESVFQIYQVANIAAGRAPFGLQQGGFPSLEEGKSSARNSPDLPPSQCINEVPACDYQ
jgi:hypothetical protein